MQSRLFMDVHVIQTLPPSNINRDDTGSPKTAQYGGVRRARVSSQSWKKAIRDYFNTNGDAQNVGVRTLEIVRYVADKIQSIDPSISEEEAMKLADQTFKTAKVSTKDQRAKALFFLGDTQADQLAEAAINGVADKKTLQEILRNNPAVDIALFGRMVADDPSLNEDASSQIAHAISTHAVQTEFDFYTAVDDLAPEDNAGAGMLGTLEFNSSTLYRYGNVAVHELMQQLESKESVINALKLFVEAFSNSMPTGKVNSYANQTIPDLILVTLRDDRPVNLVTAFETPVKSNHGNVVESVTKLFEEADKAHKFVKEPLTANYVSMVDLEANKISASELASLSTLTEQLGNDLTQLIIED